MKSSDYPTEPTTLGEKQLRDLDMTSGAIAMAVTGCTQQAAHKWLHGHSRPGLMLRGRLRELYQIPITAWELPPDGIAVVVAPRPIVHAKESTMVDAVRSIDETMEDIKSSRELGADMTLTDESRREWLKINLGQRKLLQGLMRDEMAKRDRQIRDSPELRTFLERHAEVIAEVLAKDHPDLLEEIATRLEELEI